MASCDVIPMYVTNSTAEEKTILLNNVS